MPDNATPHCAAGWIPRAEFLRIIEQINRARRLEASANFQSGRDFERRSRMGVTGTHASTCEVTWRITP